MSSHRKLLYVIFLVAAFLMVYCTRELPDITNKSSYRNLAEEVDYVGMQTCASCHGEIYNTFTNTGMGRSFDKATTEKSAASYDKHSLVYDSESNFYYQPFFKNDSLFIKEFRVEEGDTSHTRTEHIQYIVGSGQHTNSHIININGYIYQAPITFYTQDGKWDMAPGYSGERGFNERFDRLLSSECITCHNHLPTLAEGAFNKFEHMPSGIECERCHGPGAIHVEEKQAGILVDTSKGPDYTIVNPRKLPRDLQMDLCQRCHLQGVAVLEEGKTFYDFKPGMRLHEVMNVFLPRFTNSHEKFIMASQADRLRLSPCYLNSDMTCITCHNPHKSVAETGVAHFNAKCISCHQEKTCTAEQTLRDAEQDNCSSCHMPVAGSVDIPHVRITDHYISKTNTKVTKTLKNITEEEKGQFLGLQILTKEKATALEMAKGYMATYDKYLPSPIMLDSAAYYLRQVKEESSEQFNTSIHYYFTIEEYPTILNLAKAKVPSEIKDAFTAYRIGEAYIKSGDYTSALAFLEQACALMRLNLDFQEKKALALTGLQQLDKAMDVYEFILSENPKRPAALCNLGYLNVVRGNVQKGAELYDRALALNPDYEQALINKAGLALFRKDRAAAIRLLQQVLKINPNNAQALQALQRI